MQLAVSEVLARLVDEQEDGGLDGIEAEYLLYALKVCLQRGRTRSELDWDDEEVNLVGGRSIGSHQLVGQVHDDARDD